MQQASSVDPSAEDLTCAALRGEKPSWPWDCDAAAISAFQDLAEVNGTQTLLHACTAVNNWPTPLRDFLHARAVQLAMWELRHQQVLAHSLTALHAIDVQPVLIKGTALAYSLYSNPVLRTRGDTDLIIPTDAKARVHAALTSIGFVRELTVSGEFVSYQASYTRQATDGSSHILDLHWKINNSELLSRLFSYDELWCDAQPLPQLCQHALGASKIHALLIACMHRATHKQNPYYVAGVPHYDGNRLIWLYDIHLLAASLTEQEWTDFASLARQKGLRAVCLDGMQAARCRFHTADLDSVLADLAQPGTAEPLADYLAANKLRQQWLDFFALDSLADKLHFARELFFPPGNYMREKYPQPPSGWLPWLYLRRACEGLAKGLRASRSNS